MKCNLCGRSHKTKSDRERAHQVLRSTLVVRAEASRLLLLSAAKRASVFLASSDITGDNAEFMRVMDLLDKAISMAEIK